MTYRIISKARKLTEAERSTKLGRIDIWFDSQTQLWTTQYINDGGYPLSGEDWATQYSTKKTDAIAVAKKHNVLIRVETRDGSKIKQILAK